MNYTLAYPFGVDLPHSPPPPPLPKYKSIQQSQEQSPLQSPYFHSNNSILSRSSSHPTLPHSLQPTPSLLKSDLSEPPDANLLKGVLDDHYKQQISQKMQQKRMAQRQRIMQQRDFLSQLQRHSNVEAQLAKKIRQEYKGQLQQEIEIKKLQSDFVKTEENEIERRRETRKGGLVHKSESFKQFYDKAFEYREKVASQYLHYMKQEEGYALSRNSMKVFNPERHFSLQKQQGLIEAKTRKQQKQDLRRSLQRQILDQSKSRIQIKNDKMGDYSNTKRLRSIYNPIINPIDSKIDRNNRYVLNQILQRKKRLNPH